MKTRTRPVRQRRNPFQPGASPQVSPVWIRGLKARPINIAGRRMDRAFSPHHRGLRLPWALPKAGMGAGLWPSRCAAKIPQNLEELGV